MMRKIPTFVYYLLWWTGAWIVITVAMQLPECYQRSMSFDAGTPAAIDRDLVSFAEYRALLEIPFGLLWGSLSWWLYLRRFDIQRHLTLIKRLISSATISVALMQGILFGLLLSGLSVSLANLGIGNDDAPPVTINNQSIVTEAAGIVLAFVLPTLLAGCIAGRVRSRGSLS